MTTNTSTDPGLVQRTETYAEAEMLAYAGPQTCLDKVAMVKTMPKNKGVDIKFRRPVPFEPSLSPLSEGVTPNPTPFRYEDVPAKLRQFGRVVPWTDLIEDTHEDDVAKDIGTQLGDDWVRTRELLMWSELRGGTYVTYANGSSRAAVNTPITRNKQNAVVRTLERMKGKRITKVLDGSPNFSTFPIRAAYVAFSHTDLRHDIENMPGFKPVEEYGSSRPMSMYEVGAVGDVRYVLTAELTKWEDAGGAPSGSVLSTSGSSADVYPIVYVAQEAFGTVSLRGEGGPGNSAKIHIHPANQATKEDPLGQRGMAGYISWFTAKRLNERWIHRMEVAATAL